MNNPKDVLENVGGAAMPSSGNSKGEAHASGRDLDWRARIARAKEARMEGKEAREGKPITFRMTRKLKMTQDNKIPSPDRSPLSAQCISL